MRHGRPATLVAFGLLVVLAGYTIVDSSRLLSTGCIGDTGQEVCSADGPDWSRPLPATAAVLGLLAGLAGVLAGRPVRTPAMVTGFALTAAGLIAGRLLA